MNAPNFALYAAGDAYSTAAKIMGRQSAGKALVRGVARRWPAGEVHVFTPEKQAAVGLAEQLRNDGHKGMVRWRCPPGDARLDALGAVYHPAPVTPELAHARNTRGMASYSLFGVTHTISSARAADQIAAMVTAPFQPWDALICTSRAAHAVVSDLQAAQRAWLTEHIGATRFTDIRLPIIPLGIDAPGFMRAGGERHQARSALSIAPHEVAFLFAGRLSYHAKANPAVLYAALEAAAALTETGIVCIEAGVFPNTAIRDAFRKAQRQVAPSVRFVHVDGQDDALYRQAWVAADVFTSLSDNIQETFGLTPLEAMAAGLPVLVTDWNGYKDTVRDGVDGFRIPVVLPPDGAGADLALRHAVGVDNYDYFIGRVSAMTLVDGRVLRERIVALCNDEALRRRLGQEGQSRALGSFDWPVVLDQYTQLVDELGAARRAAAGSPSVAWPARPDPAALFRGYPTQVAGRDWLVARVAEPAGLKALFDLSFARFVVDPETLPIDVIEAIYAFASEERRFGDLLDAHPAPLPIKLRALMWLCKFGVLEMRPS